VTKDATNDETPRVAASWANGGVGGLRLGGELAARGLFEPRVLALGDDLAQYCAVKSSRWSLATWARPSFFWAIAAISSWQFIGAPVSASTFAAASIALIRFGLASACGLAFLALPAVSSAGFVVFFFLAMVRLLLRGFGLRRRGYRDATQGQ